MIPESIKKFQKDYREGAWREYSEEEYMWWIRLLTKRATHRSDNQSKQKDLEDASHYLAMWRVQVDESEVK